MNFLTRHTMAILPGFPASGLHSSAGRYKPSFGSAPSTGVSSLVDLRGTRQALLSSSSIMLSTRRSVCQVRGALSSPGFIGSLLGSGTGGLAGGKYDPILAAFDLGGASSVVGMMGGGLRGASYNSGMVGSMRSLLGGFASSNSRSASSLSGLIYRATGASSSVEQRHLLSLAASVASLGSAISALFVDAFGLLGGGRLGVGRTDLGQVLSGMATQQHNQLFGLAGGTFDPNPTVGIVALAPSAAASAINEELSALGLDTIHASDASAEELSQALPDELPEGVEPEEDFLDALGKSIEQLGDLVSGAIEDAADAIFGSSAPQFAEAVAKGPTRTAPRFQSNMLVDGRSSVDPISRLAQDGGSSQLTDALLGMLAGSTLSGRRKSGGGGLGAGWSLGQNPYPAGGPYSSATSALGIRSRGSASLVGGLLAAAGLLGALPGSTATATSLQSFGLLSPTGSWLSPTSALGGFLSSMRAVIADACAIGSSVAVVLREAALLERLLASDIAALESLMGMLDCRSSLYDTLANELYRQARLAALRSLLLAGGGGLANRASSFFPTVCPPGRGPMTGC